jgi:ATPase subunit of ABC transporter with duplicated ATPase domains
VLDEPTNHLDLTTEEVRLDSLNAFDVSMRSHRTTAFLRASSNRVPEPTPTENLEAAIVLPSVS